MKEGYIPRDKRKKVLMLSDDIRTHSGVGNMAKEIIINSAHHFNWINLGGAVKHPDMGKGFDLSDDINNILLGNRSGNISYILNKGNRFHYRFAAQTNRILNFDWWMDNANPETVEFVYKHRTSTINQGILKSSGSGNQTLWDLRVIPSSNSGVSSSIQFRLSNKLTGSNTSNDIGKSAVSMSTDYLGMGSGELWNILLKRTSGSSNLSGYPSASHNAILSHSYDLYVSKQKGDSISIFNAVSRAYCSGVSTAIPSDNPGSLSQSFDSIFPVSNDRINASKSEDWDTINR